MNKKKYKVNDVVWVAACQNRLVEQTCPVCFGKLKVTLILGNDDTVVLPCDYCGKGYEGPKGFVSEYELIVGAEQKTITQVSIEETRDGDIRQYHAVHNYYKEDEVFDTKEEAEAKSQEEATKYNEQQAIRKDHIRRSSNKNYTWLAGYHTRSAKKARQEADRHDGYAVICKAKART